MLLRNRTKRVGITLSELYLTAYIKLVHQITVRIRQKIPWQYGIGNADTALKLKLQEIERMQQNATTKQN